MIGMSELKDHRSLIYNLSYEISSGMLDAWDEGELSRSMQSGRAIDLRAEFTVTRNMNDF